MLLLSLIIAGASTTTSTKPNIVLFLTDDEDVVLGGFGMGGGGDTATEPTQPLPRHVPALRSRGTLITHWYANTPVCCPSRANILTGRYFHSLAWSDPNRWDTTPSGHPRQCMHINESALSPGPTFAAPLAAAGYNVGFFGKYLNISPRRAPTGAHTYFVNPGPAAKSVADPTGEYYPQFWYHINATHNGTTAFNGTQYETHIIANAATAWLRSVVVNEEEDAAKQQQQQQQQQKPFFLYVAPHSPHGAAIPEPKYEGVFGSNVSEPRQPRVRAPRTPSWNVSAPDHHWLVAQQQPVTPVEVRWADVEYARRWECLLSYDDLVGRVVDEVEALGETPNTYFFLTSDHGFHFHELRLGVGKWSVYETDIRVPMLVVGPGVSQNATARGLVGSHADLTPTWLELAGVARPAWVDGRSVAWQLLGGGMSSNGDGDVSSSSSSSSRSVGLRPANAAYVEYHGLGMQVRHGKRIMDSFNNTFRAIRLVDGPDAGLFNTSENLLYAEWGGDFLFKSVVFREVYDMDVDPWQMHNLYDEWNHTHKLRLEQLEELTHAMYHCKGSGCL